MSGGPAVPDAATALALLDWRRRVFTMYADVRSNPDHVAAHAAWRSARDAMFATHPQSPLPAERRATFTGLPVAPYDETLRFECHLDASPPQRRDVPTGTDGIVSFDRIGSVQLAELGSLDVWELVGYAGGLFVPLRDATAGATTYGGGRYVIDTRKGADLGGDPARGTLVVDLNYAYHPSCAYDPAWACPLAPTGNVLAGPVNAGELLPAGGWY
jgi:uncharacterized protein (DUF1684 family)